MGVIHKVEAAHIRFEERLKKKIEGNVLFDDYSLGRYSTDASIYQIKPIGVVVPKTINDVETVFSVAIDCEVPVLARGAGTSQCGQTVNRALVVDTSKYLDHIISLDVEARRVVVEPGLILDRLNQFLRPHGLWFPVDISTSSQATIGGMVGNNSCGARSIRYGTMRDNVLSIEALLADGRNLMFGVRGPERQLFDNAVVDETLRNKLLEIGEREADEIDLRFPKLMRRVGGYNIDSLVPNVTTPENLAHILVGSEGTLAFFKKVELALSPLPSNTILGVCHFHSFHDAMTATKSIVSLGPTAVELIDRTMIDLARRIEIFRHVISEVIKADSESVLLVEFAEADEATNLRKLNSLVEMMGDLGHGESTVMVGDPAQQKAIWEVRKQALNIVMSMKGDGKPISFVEDCAVELDDLPEYTSRLNEIFLRYGTKGTWYAHASVGTLHVRPVLNLKLDEDVRKMRAIAEETFAMVRQYKGSHSGEHGDGIVRSEFHKPMFGSQIVDAFAEIKTLFDPSNMLNPGRIVNPPSMDDRSLLRFNPTYTTDEFPTEFDWSSWGSFSGAVEMCNNNGACRKLSGGAMCPSFRATRDEQHSTRGRANVLRLALSGQLGLNGITSDAMEESLKLCIGCKACRRECPTGIDMARMKTEIMHKRIAKTGLSIRDRLIGFFPRYAPWFAKIPNIANLCGTKIGSALRQPLFGLSKEQALPIWAQRSFETRNGSIGPTGGAEVVVFADCFNRYFEPHNLQAAVEVLVAGGSRVHFANSVDGDGRPLCCGKTFLSVGLVEEARKESIRLVKAISEWVERGVPLIGLEPSCIFTIRDDLKDLVPGSDIVSRGARLVEEYLLEGHRSGSVSLNLKSANGGHAAVHGHCHQKASNAFTSTLDMLRLIPDINVDEIESTCCGMAGAFGYQADTYKISREIGELEFLPAIRNVPKESFIIADGTSCRHQVASVTGRKASHAITVLRDFLQ